MSTPAFAPNNKLSGIYQYDSSIMPKQKPTSQQVREEIRRQKQIEALKQDYKAGKISEFSYRAQMFFLMLPEISDALEPKFSTTA